MLLKLYAAHEVDVEPTPLRQRTVEKLAGRAHLRVPKVYPLDDAQPNANCVACSSRANHVRNRRILTSTLTASIVGAISMLAQFGTLSEPAIETSEFTDCSHLRSSSPGRSTAERPRAGGMPVDPSPFFHPPAGGRPMPVAPIR